MSYYDQYNSRNANSGYPPQQYADPAEAAYNPYDNAQPHQTYEQAGYGYQDNGYGAYRDEPSGSSSPPRAKLEKNAYQSETFAASGRTLAPKCVPHFDRTISRILLMQCLCDSQNVSCDASVAV